MVEPTNSRPPNRPPEDAPPRGSVDHLDRARKRMAEIRMLMGDGLEADLYVDRFFAQAPAGWAYNWKRFSVFNKEYPAEFAEMLRQGWSPVPADRHRDLLYPEYAGEHTIIDGLILMERPKELNDRREKQAHDMALAQVRAKEAAMIEAPSGQDVNHRHPELRQQIRSSIGPANIPE